MPIFRAEELRKAGAAMLGAAGAPPEEALIVARELVEANLVGHDSHGVIRIPQYVDSMRRGEIDPGRPVEIAHEPAVGQLLARQHELWAQLDPALPPLAPSPPAAGEAHKGA